MATVLVELSGGDYGGTAVDWTLDVSGNPIAEFTVTDGAGGTWAYAVQLPGDPRGFLVADPVAFAARAKG
jgi:hypothetical protein